MNQTTLPYSVQDFPRLSALQNVSHRDSVGSGNLPFASMDHQTSTTKVLQRFFRRLLKPSTLDFETATWEMFHLILNPRKMYRLHYYKLQGRALYTRDDPAFLVLLTGFLCVSAIAWGLAYSPRFLDILQLIAYMVVVDFYVNGVVIATLFWIVVNRIVNGRFIIFDQGNTNRLKVNYIAWGFCWDIHCNSFVVIWCLLYVLQFFLLPVLSIKKLFIARLLGNLLYFGTLIYYFVVSFYGYNLLPFVTSGSGSRQLQSIVLMGILPLLFIGWLLSIVLGFNVVVFLQHIYFS